MLQSFFSELIQKSDCQEFNAHKSLFLFIDDRELLHYSKDKGALGHNYRKVMAKIYGAILFPEEELYET